MKEIYLEENFNRIYSSILVDLLIKQGVSNYYISPGMRNVPIISALLNRKDEVNLYSTIDERAAAYRALGFSKTNKTPAVIICTSGTALANYLPAVIESYKVKSPLIIISADRPFELVHSGANQTINQSQIFSPFIKHFIQLEIEKTQSYPRAFSNILNHYFEKTKEPSCEMVHINFAMNEPLDSTKENIPPKILNEIKELSAPIYYNKNERPSLSHMLSEVITLIEEKQGLIVFGNLSYHKNINSIKNFLEIINNAGQFLYLDITSSLKLNSSILQNLIPSFDHPEVIQIIKEKPPKFIIHFGGQVTSKSYYQYLKENPSISLITVHNNEEMQDPSHQQNLHIHMTTSQFTENFLKKKIKYNQSFKGNYFSKKYQQLIKKKINIIDQADLTYPVISKHIMESCKEGDHLFLANSTIIRSFDNYTSPISTQGRHVNIHSNRGASGIEGLIATTIGISDSLKKPIDLIVGDISFLYDLNSLHMLKDIKNRINIFICNNSSGGIFTLLPISKDKEVLPYITTPHNVKFKYAAKMFDITYQEIDSIDEFKLQYAKRNSGQSKINIFELIICNDENTKIYNELKTVKL